MITPLEITEKIDQYWRGKVKRYPCRANRPSDMGFPCLRKRVYEFKNWNEKTIDADAYPRMEDGNVHEDAVVMVLEGAGFKITARSTPFYWDKYNISGRIDGKIFEVETRKEYPIEIKAQAALSWAKIDNAGDFKYSEDWWTRGYYSQIQIYMLMDNSEKGFFVLKNKTSGKIKIIEVPLDYEFGEKVLREVEEVNRYLKTLEGITDQVALNAKMPPKINDPDVCPRCPFVHVCLPDYATAGIEFVDDNNLLLKLRKYEELKTTNSEYNALDKELKELLKEKQMSVGEYLITGKWINKKEVPVQPAIKYWSKKIQKIDKTGAAVNTGDGHG